MLTPVVAVSRATADSKCAYTPTVPVPVAPDEASATSSDGVGSASASLASDRR